MAEIDKCSGCEVGWMYEEGIILPVQALNVERLCDPCAIVEEADFRSGDGIIEDVGEHLPAQSFRVVSRPEEIDSVPEDLNAIEASVYVAERDGGVIYRSRNFNQSR